MVGVADINIDGTALTTGGSACTTLVPKLLADIPTPGGGITWAGAGGGTKVEHAGISGGCTCVR